MNAKGKVVCVVALGLWMGAMAKDAEFSRFRYEGRDERRLNPVMRGMAPDPSVTRKGEWFYLANSSFSYWPGIPIWRSRNLVDWEFVDFALKRPSQLTLPKGIGLSAGIFAPDIKYNPHNNTFYLLVTIVGNGGNVLYKSKDPALGWSDPIKLGFHGIDPGIYFEDAKTAYIVNNADAPDNKPEYSGHRTIRCRPYDLETDTCHNEREVILVNKGVRPEEKPIWCEGPHIYKIGGTYYLMTAEGGTADGHSEVIWRGESPMGPFKPCKINPILTQRDLPNDRPNPITAAGHADIIEDTAGRWWAVFLGIVPYRDATGRKFCNTGRSTFLLPVTWIGDGDDRQPLILEAGKEIPRDLEGVQATGDRSQEMPWFQIRTPREDWYAIKGDKIRVTAREESINALGNPSCLCKWVLDQSFTASVRVDFDATGDKEIAGMAYYQNERHCYVIGKTKHGVVLRKNCCDTSREIARLPLDGTTAFFRIESVGAKVRFFAGNDGKTWTQIGGDEDATILSTDHAGGFVGAVIGLYAEK